MTKLTDLEYLRLGRWRKFLYKFANFFVAIPHKFVAMIFAIGRFFKRIGLAIVHEFSFIGMTFVKGDWKTKVSYLIFGFGNLTRRQILRGILFFIFEVVFIIYMVLYGGYWLGKFGTLGTIPLTYKTVNVPGVGDMQVIDTSVPADDSFKILLYGLLTIIFIIAAVATWRMNIAQNAKAEEILRAGKPLRSAKEDLKSLVDDQFHKTLLAIPLTGILIFTVLPIIFMIAVAFTNYDGSHDGYKNLFTWVGWKNFNELFSWTSGSNNVMSLSAAFGEILGWTLIWAFFATFSNYFLGMIVAMIINKKGIRFKKVWRGILVLTSAVPQFISLIYISKMFNLNSVVNGWLKTLHIIKENYNWWGYKTSARVLVILINIWIGIPYLMLITSGVLMNIPADLYESAKIDGANAWQSLVKITVPYMFFVTGPYLLTSFTGNLNNFNVIYLLTGGGPDKKTPTKFGSVGNTDLLITWLFDLTNANSNYRLSSVIGILIFVVVAFLSLIVYNLLPSNRNEEDFS